MRSSLLIVTSAALLAACGSHDAPAGADGVTGGTVVVAMIGDPGKLFPPLVTDQNAHIVSDLVFDHLADIGPDLSTIGDKDFSPRLAKRWAWAPDSLSIAFSLDPRAHWHDGKPVTASDVKYSFKVYTDPQTGSPIAPLLANVDSVSVKDSLTAVVWFKKRTPGQFFDVAYQLVPIPEHVYGSIPLADLHTSEAVRSVVGDGRFRLVKWEPKVRIELLADTASYRGRAKLDRVIFTPVADAIAGSALMLTGQADFLENYPIDQVGKLDGSAIAKPLIVPAMGYTFMGFNQHAPKSHAAPNRIMGDPRVRRALAMAVDRVGMLQNVFGTHGRIGHGPFSMTLPFADSTLHLQPYDAAAAKALLDSAGWRAGPDGMRAKNGAPLRFTVISPTTSLLRRQYGVLLQEQFHKIGAQMDLDQMDNNAFFARGTQGDFDGILMSFQPDPTIIGTTQNWGTSGIGGDGQNILMYSNRNVDALLDSASASFDQAKAKTLAARAFQRIVDDVPAIFLYDVTTVDAINRRIVMAPPRIDGWFTSLADWTIPPDKRIDRDRIGLAAPKP